MIGWMDGWMDDWMDRWMDGWMEIYNFSKNVVSSSKF